jgi:hypothetical protein
VDDLPFSIPTNPPPPPASPPPDPDQKRRVALAAGLALLWGILTLLAQLSGALDTLEEPLLDWRLSINSNPLPPSDQLALIAIDDIPPNHPWPWSRLDYSLELRSLIDYAPQSIVFEMNLNDRDTEYMSFDQAFSDVVQRANIVIFAATVLSSASSTPLPANLVPIPADGNLRQVPQFGSAIWPLDTFAGSSPVGANNLESESGLRLRRIPLVFMLEGKVIPSLVLQATAQLLEADLASSEIHFGRALLLRRKDGKLLRTIPVDDQGRMRIRYHQGPSTSWQASFDNVMLSDDQIQQNIVPDRDLRTLARRQVWIGRTDPGERERFQTAVGQLSRVEVQLQAERTILDQDYIRPLPPMILAALYLLIAVGGAAFVIRSGPLASAAMSVVLASAWFGLAFLAFRVYNVILPLPSFAMLLLGTYAVAILASLWDLDPEEDTRQLPLEL